jgi:chromate transport protein ChrA
MPSSPPVIATRASLAELVGYFLYLGTLGFGGPVALAGFMHRDLVEKRRWIDESEYLVALASLGVLWRFKVSEPILVAVAGVVGLIVWPLVKGG